VQGLVCEPLLIEDLCLISPRGGASARSNEDTASLNEVAELPLILPSMSSGLRSLIEEAANERGIKVNTLLEIDSVTATKELVTKGVGHGILPLGAVKREVDDGRIIARRFTDPTLSREMYLVYSAKRPSSNATAAIREIMHAVVEDNIKSGAWAWRPVAQ
jgi:LysR family nitrogen assimilation transcriptional regulator